MQSEQEGDQEAETGSDRSGRNLPPPIYVPPESRGGGASVGAITCLCLGISSGVLACCIPPGFLLGIAALSLAWVEHRKRPEERTEKDRQFVKLGVLGAIIGVTVPLVLILTVLLEAR
ncbi:hypothetical protein GC173_12415 [bacterium]|nr:hypothetical protein [bacterium]